MDSFLNETIDKINDPNTNIKVKKLLLFRLYGLLGRDSEIIQNEVNYRNFKTKILGSYVHIARKRAALNREYFASTYESYRSIIDSTCDLVDELDLTDPISISNLYTYLVWNGFYSINSKNLYTNEGRKNLIGMMSCDIMNGKSVCLNHSAMLCDILSNKKYDAAIINNNSRIGSKKLDHPSLIREVGETKQSFISALLALPLLMIVGTHMCTLIKDGDKYGVYDPTNILGFHLVDKKHAASLVDNSSLKFRAFTSYLFNVDEANSALLDELFLHEGEFKEIPGIDLARKKFLEQIDFFDDERSLLEDFHDSIYCDIKNIRDGIKNAEEVLRLEK